MGRVNLRSWNLSALLTAALLATACSAASAAPGVTIPRYAAEYAVDGDAAYWAIDRQVGSDPDLDVDTLIVRGAMNSKARKRLLRLKAKDHDFFSGAIVAGGGYVYVTVRSFDPIIGGPTTWRVIRLAGDGSRRDVVASGVTLDAPDASNSTFVPGDCGTTVDAIAAGPDGSVVIEEDDSDRASSACGGKTPVDHWRYYEIGLTGARREIYSRDLPGARSPGPVPIDCIGELLCPGEGTPVTNAQVIGDRALFVSSATNTAYIRDLATGQLSAAMKSGIPAYRKSTSASMSSDGRVALMTELVKSRRSYVSYSASEVFTRPLDPTSRKRVPDPSFAASFCGNTLVAIGRGGAVELDPATLKRSRVLAKMSDVEALLGDCTSDRFYTMIDTKKGQRIRAHRIP